MKVSRNEPSRSITKTKRIPLQMPSQDGPAGQSLQEWQSAGLSGSQANGEAWSMTNTESMQEPGVTLPMLFTRSWAIKVSSLSGCWRFSQCQEQESASC